MNDGRRTGSSVSRRRTWGLLALVLISAILGVSRCKADRATSEDCEKMLDRIVELELSERGFRDPVLLAQKQQDLRRLLEPELRQCQGKRLKPATIECIAQATSTEQISHRCLH
jgi:hypothetical protein